jgi:hypothetical protein
MINTLLNSLQLYRSKYTADLVDQNSIAYLNQSQPYRMSSVLSYIMGTQYNMGILQAITGGIGRTVTIDQASYEWDVMIEAQKPVTIKAAQWQGAAIASTDVPGINGTPITVWVADKFFGPGAIVEFDDKNYQARVMSEPYQDGVDWVYTLVVADGQANSYIPPSLLAVGKQLSTMGSAYEEYSEEADIIVYQSPVRLRNYLTIRRLSWSITGSAASTAMVIEMKNPDTGAKTKLWADYQLWLALKKWHAESDYQLVYDRTTVNADGSVSLKGTNGRPIYRGAGLLQQISPANKRTYTTLTKDILEESLYDASYNLRSLDNRNYLLLSGEMGLKEFDRVVKAELATLDLTDTHFVSGSGMNLTFGGQFKTYNLPNGISITVKHFPPFDDTYHNRKLHPTTGKPIESYKYLILDNGSVDGEPNIQKVVRKDREMVMWATGGSYIPGLGHSTTQTAVRSNARDGGSIHILGEYGIWMKNPTTSFILECDAE